MTSTQEAPQATTTSDERPAPTRIRTALANVKLGMTFTLGDTDWTVVHVSETGMRVVRPRDPRPWDREHRGMIHDTFSTESMFNRDLAGNQRLEYPEGARMVDVHVPVDLMHPRRNWNLTVSALNEGIDYWGNVNAALDLIESAPADTYAKVKLVLDAYAVDIDRADGYRMPVSTDAGHAFFSGSGGDRSLASALRRVGWRKVWSEAAYHYIAENPADPGNVLHYIEGDVDLMTRPAAEKWVAAYAARVNA